MAVDIERWSLSAVGASGNASDHQILHLVTGEGIGDPFEIRPLRCRRQAPGVGCPAATLLPVIVSLAPASSVVARFPAAFAEVATRIEIGASVVDDEVARMATWTLATTASRSVLGVMNEFAHLADNYRDRHEPLDLVELSLWLDQVPCSRPSVATKGWIGATSWSHGCCAACARRGT